VSSAHRAVAAELGRAIAATGWSLVYGGGSIGLMGEVARAALHGGAHVTGVIPHRLATREVLLEGVSELIQTDTMRERKQLMDQRSDAFVVLPGGLGTLEELVEIVTLKQLGYHERAIVLLDAEGYWDPLVDQFTRVVEHQLADPSNLELWAVARDVPETMRALRQYRPPPMTETSPDQALEVVQGPPDGGSIDMP
jgi:uncharacterized protein (TIGR00730 family)